MNNRIQGLFSTPVYFAMVDNKSECESEFNRVSPNLYFYETPEMWGKPHKLTTQNFEDNIIDVHQMDVIKKVIDVHIGLFLDALKITKYE